MVARKNLTIALSVTEYVTLIAEAEKANLSLSEYARRRIFSKKVTPRTPIADVEAIAEMRRVGGLLKQVWSSCRSVPPGETWEMLQAAKRILHTLEIGLSSKQS